MNTPDAPEVICRQHGHAWLPFGYSDKSVDWIHNWARTNRCQRCGLTMTLEATSGTMREDTL